MKMNLQMNIVYIYGIWKSYTDTATCLTPVENSLHGQLTIECIARKNVPQN
jgi:hypothetical protein